MFNTKKADVGGNGKISSPNPQSQFVGGFKIGKNKNLSKEKSI